MDFSVTKFNWGLLRKCPDGWGSEYLNYDNSYIIVILLEGNVLYKHKNREILAKKNDILIFPPGFERSGFSRNTEFVTINFHLETDMDANIFFNSSYVHIPNAGNDIRNKFLDIAYVWEGQKPLCHIRCKNLLSDLLYTIIYRQYLNRDTTHTKKLEDVRTYIQANFKTEIEIPILAEKINMSVSHFRKLFKQTYGLSPMQYITNLRISYARDLLQSGEVNISEIAILSGFKDIYYFSRIFKKYTGTPPSNYINKKF